MKKISFLLLSVILSMVSIQAFAYDVAVENGNGKTIYYDYVNGTELRVTSGDNNYSGDINIPANVTIGNNVYSVTSIGDWAFSYCYNLTSITIPNGVTSIGEHAFLQCFGLTYVIIPNSVTSIENDAFSHCLGLTSIIVAEGNTVYDSRDNCNAIIETASNTLLYGCKNTIIPNSVTGIGGGAFSGYSGLTSITIPNSVTSIGNYAFSGCSGLTSITIPNSVTSIGIWAFSSCSGITSITVAEGNTVYDSRDNCNAIIETASNTLISGCKNTIIPNSVTSIESSAFSDCSGLTSIVIPKSVTSIGNYAFIGCTGLTSITIPNSVTSIGGEAFNKCSGLTSITVAEGNSVYDSRDNCNAIIETASNTLLYGCKNTIIPNSVTRIGDWAFGFCSGLTSVTIPKSVTSIGNVAFYMCSRLTSVVSLIKSPSNFDSSAFGGISSDCVLTVPRGTRDAYIAAGWTEDVFKGGVVEAPAIDFADANVKALCVANWDTNGDGELDVVEAAAVTDLGEVFRNNSTITSFDELQYFTGLTSIGNYAFYQCFSLTSITIPNSVTSIGNAAFHFCSGLTSITIPNSVTSIGNNAFSDCSGLTSITIPNSVTSIGIYAFSGCSVLTSITIPNSVTSIGISPFYLCSGLTSIIVEEGNTVYDSRDNCNAIIETVSNTLLYGCKNTFIPNSVTSIGDDAFRSCSSLTSITIPNSVTSIGNNAFNGCSGLTSITIPNSVTSIGAGAFYLCSGLTSITIPNGVTSIGEYVFGNCSGLTSVISLIESPFSFGSSAFSYISSDCILTVPRGTRDAYIAAGWTEDVFKGGVVEAPAIDFADANVKALCVSNWDTNSDGELDVFEAAAVTGLGEVFTNNPTITSFDELRYFTGLTSIGSAAFQHCSALTSIIIPNSVTSIGQNAFSWCSGLTSITVAEGNTVYDSRNNCNAIIETASNTLVSGCENSFIPNSVTSIGAGAFNGCSGLTSITIPNSVTSIGNWAFYGCSDLTSVLSLVESPFNFGTVAFGAISSDCVLTVPYGTRDAYIAAGWTEDVFKGGIIENSLCVETDVTRWLSTDWKEWVGATGYTPTWALPMVTTNDGRNVQLCERFNLYVPEGKVLYRTFTGLTNGIYRIELYSVAASTKTSDTSIDTDMTAADDGDKTAVYLYVTTANGTVKHYIPVKWAVDFLNTVVFDGVVVTDGTLEIGMYGEKKFANWETIQIKGVSALVDAETFHLNTLQKAETILSDAAYVNVIGEERTTLQNVIADCAVVMEYTTDAYQTAVTALENAIEIFVDAKESYDTFVATKKMVEERSYPYATQAKKTAAEDAIAVTASSAADAVSKTETILTTWRQYAESSALMEGVEGSRDVTDIYILNPKAEAAIDNNVWQIVRGEGSDGYIKILHDQPWTDGSGSTNHRYFDGGNWFDSAWDVTFKQNITLPAGRYQLTALGRAQTDVNITLFAGDVTAEMAHISVQNSLFNNGWEQTSVEFELTQGTTVSIGVKGVTNALHNWMSFSDFRLVHVTKIIFADANVKALCVANWDTNGDGELDVFEAAAVTDLGNVFRHNSTITSFDELQYFTGLTSIGNFSFSHCSGLTSITIPNSVTSIGTRAFEYCSGLTSITIPNSVTSIGNYAFYLCSGLTSITIPNSVTSIGNYAFSGCSGLTSITIPNSVTSIGDSAFSGCSGLTSITIPNSVTSIGTDAFNQCSGLTSITVAEGNTVYDSRGNCNAVIETASNTLVVGCKNTIIPNSVTSIGNYAFRRCSGLTSITIPNSVTSIGTRAFEYCSGLTSITIPNSVTSIGRYAFSYCSGLTSITIPNSVTSIGNSAFNGCSGLTSITIPNSVTSIEYGAFVYCSGLTSITVAEGNTVYDSRGNCNAVIETASNTLVSGCKNTVIPNSVTSIGDAAFYGCSGLTSITIPNSVTSIGNYAFRGCSGLTSITIPNSVTSIGDYAFSGCSGLTSVISLIESPYSFGSYAFSVISSDCVLTVPLGTRDAYIAAGWTEDVFKGGVVDVLGANNKLVVSDTEICLGNRRILPIELQNETNVTAIQFDIVLPDGFSIAENQNGKLIVSKTSRCSDHTLSTAKQNENTYRVLLYSVDLDEITGNSGAVINVTLETADNIAEGPYEVRISNINLTMPDETKILPADATCTFTVRDVISGDSNGDGVVDVTDIVGIANAILGRAGNTFDPLAADLNGDGVFDVTDIVVLANLILHGNSQPGVKAFNISDLLDPQ